MDKARVFVVDDDRDFADSLALALETRDCEVELAHTGEEAVERSLTSDFDIVFMDVRLPGQSGVESFLRIREEKPNLPVVLMTGYSVDELMDQALEKGALAVLGKPLDMNKVLSIVANLPSPGILVVDDDPDFVDSLREVLAQAGKRVIVAGSGQEALDAVRSGRIDVIVLDLRMPGWNGARTVSELRERGFSHPTVVVTAYSREESEQIHQLQELSVKEFLGKPCDPEVILATVERLQSRG